MLEKVTKMSFVEEAPFHAYEGDEPYIFASYAHADAHMVFPELKRLNDLGLNIWYDQGIAPGNEWTEEIGEALDGCSLFIVFISRTSAESINVRNEINYALHEKKHFLAIYLEETELPPGLKLGMGSLQAILKYSMDESEYHFRCEKAFRQNGFDISDGKVTYTKPVPRSHHEPEKPSKFNMSNLNIKTPHIIIGAVVLIAIIAVVALVGFGGDNSDDVVGNIEMTIDSFKVEQDSDYPWNYSYSVWGTLSGIINPSKDYTVYSEFYDGYGDVVYTDQKVFAGKDINGSSILASASTDSDVVEKVSMQLKSSRGTVLAECNGTEISYV